MRRMGLWTVAALIALPVLPPFTTIAAQRPVPPFRITALKAMLFYGQTGTFSADLFGPAAPTLQNVRTGEGQSQATLVVVETAGQPDSYAPARKIGLTATASGRVLLNRTVSLGRPGADGKFHAAFWLYDTGCAAVSLEARLVGQPEKSVLKETIRFKCGD
jgi:hypothetical protein